MGGRNLRGSLSISIHWLETLGTDLGKERRTGDPGRRSGGGEEGDSKSGETHYLW